MVMLDYHIIHLLLQILCLMVYYYNIIIIIVNFVKIEFWKYFKFIGSFCIYANEDSFEYIRSSLEKTLLSNLEQEDRLPFQGLPIVIMFIPESTIDEMEAIRLRKEGQNLADR